MRNVYIFLAASLGCVVLAAVAFVGPRSIIYAIAPQVHAAQCSRVIEGYGDGRDLPERGTDEYKRYADCYYVICGIRI